jgi:hypothetical protein
LRGAVASEWRGGSVEAVYKCWGEHCESSHRENGIDAAGAVGDTASGGSGGNANLGRETQLRSPGGDRCAD